MSFGFDLDIDLSSAVKRYSEAFEEYGTRAFPRAVQFALTGVSIDAADRFRKAMPAVLDRPVPWVIRGVASVKADLNVARLDEVSSAIKIRPDQSAILKYQMGLTDQVRRPGDVGLAERDVWIPVPDNIRKVTGTRLQQGNVPSGTASAIKSRMAEKPPAIPYQKFGARLKKGRLGMSTVEFGMQTRIRDAEARRKREAYQKRWGVFEGEIKVHGQPVKAVIGRPPRTTWDKASADARLAFKSRNPGAETRSGFLDRRAHGRSVPQMVPVDTPRILFILKARATYQPVLQPAWTAAAEAAVATLPDRLEKELAEKASFRASRSSS
jgi:hypothetical protein